MEPNPYEAPKERGHASTHSRARTHLRNAHFWGAVIMAGLTLATGILHLAGVHRIPILDQMLLVPALMFTWFFILGDRGTDHSHMLFAIGIGTPCNALLRWLAGIVINVVSDPPDSPTRDDEERGKWTA